jgi:hypothetical protein
VTEGELVEIGLQVLVAHRAGMRADEPALQQRDRPVAALNRIVLAPLCLGLDDSIVAPLADALGVIAGVPVRDDVRGGRNLAVGEALHGVPVIVVDVGEPHSSVGLGGHQNQLLVRAAFASDQRLVDLPERVSDRR